MNFLAHLYLSKNDDDLLIGNLIADFIRNKEVANYTSAIQKGIYLHRQIDMFTDNHKTVRKGTHRLQPRHHKYSPVVIDIFYDYFLANNWDKYHEKSLQDFADGAYKVLEKNFDLMPKKLKKSLPKMIEHNWLLGYKSLEGMRFTFEKMSERTQFPDCFSHAVDDMQEDLQKYDQEFNEFFPDVISFVDECLEN